MSVRQVDPEAGQPNASPPELSFQGGKFPGPSQRVLSLQNDRFGPLRTGLADEFGRCEVGILQQIQPVRVYGFCQRKGSLYALPP